MNKNFCGIKKIFTFFVFGLLCVGFIAFCGIKTCRENCCNNEIMSINNYVYADEGVRIPPDSPTEKKEKQESNVDVQNVFIICIVIFLVVNSGIVVTINVIKDRRHKAIFERLEKERMGIESDENGTSESTTISNAGNYSGNGTNN